jgi:hypothetical protein
VTTARELLTDTAKLIGVVRKSEALDADEATDGLRLLNDMLGSWVNNGLLVISRVTESFAVSSAMSYTIGTGQTLNTTRPLNIVSATFTIGSIDYDLQYITEEEYALIAMKSQGGTPQFYTYDNANPYGTIKLYPQSAGTLNLISEKPLTEFASLATTITLPPGWNRALKYNLAIDWAPQFGEQVPAEVVKIAIESKADIALSIAKNRPIRASYPVQTGNIYNGYYH